MQLFMRSTAHVSAIADLAGAVSGRAVRFVLAVGSYMGMRD